MIHFPPVDVFVAVVAGLVRALELRTLAPTGAVQADLAGTHFGLGKLDLFAISA